MNTETMVNIVWGVAIIGFAIVCVVVIVQKALHGFGTRRY